MSSARHDEHGTITDDMELPPMPAVAMRLIQMSEDPSSSASDLAAVIETDAALTLSLLQASNSSLYGFSGLIDTVPRAVVVMGTNAVRSLAVAIAGGQMFASEGECLEQRSQLWQHSLGCAIVGRLLALHTGSSPDEPFLAGIFHDIGKLLFFRRSPELYRDVFALSDLELALSEERNLFGMSHEEASEVCAEDWGLPIETQNAIRLHHSPDKLSDRFGLPEIIYAANTLATAWGIGVESHRTIELEPILQRFALDEELIAKLQEATDHQFADVSKLCLA